MRSGGGGRVPQHISVAANFSAWFVLLGFHLPHVEWKISPFALTSEDRRTVLRSPCIYPRSDRKSWGLAVKGTTLEKDI